MGHIGDQALQFSYVYMQFSKIVVLVSQPKKITLSN